MKTSTSIPIPNQIVGRYCPASLLNIQGKKYVRLRYVPRALRVINSDTSPMNKDEEK